MTIMHRVTLLLVGICCTWASKLNVTMLKDSSGLSHGKFGHRIASYGEVVAVGNRPIKGSEAKVILFSNFEESVVIHNKNEKVIDFGDSIEMNENSVVISAPMDKAGGSVHIYDKNGTFIAQINGKDVDPLIKPNAEFGSSIKFLTCNLLLIGAKNNGQSGSGDVFVFTQIDSNVWVSAGSFNAGSEAVNFGNHIAYDSVTSTIMVSSLNNVYLYSLDQIKDIVTHNGGGIFVGALDVIEFYYEVGNVVMGHNYAMVSFYFKDFKENDHIKWNYVTIYSIGADHTVSRIQSISPDNLYTEKGNSLYITERSSGDVVFMVGAKSSTKSCVLVYCENTIFDDDGDSVFSSLCADTDGFGSSVAVVNNDVYIGYEMYNEWLGGIATGAVAVFSNYLYINALDDDVSGDNTITEKDVDDYTMHVEEAPSHHASSSMKDNMKAITISMASLACIAVIYCIYYVKYNDNKHKLINGENDGETDGLPGETWNEKMQEQQALNISKEIV